VVRVRVAALALQCLEPGAGVAQLVPRRARPVTIFALSSSAWSAAAMISSRSCPAS
jgi:hypothetical protein